MQLESTVFSYHAVLLLHELPVHDVRGRRVHGEHRVAVILDDIVVIAGAGHTLRHLALQLTSLGVNAPGLRVRSRDWNTRTKSREREKERDSLGEQDRLVAKGRDFNATTDNNSALSQKYRYGRASNHSLRAIRAYVRSSTERPPTWSSNYIESQPTVAAVAASPTTPPTGALPVTSPPSWSLIRAIAPGQSTRPAASRVAARSDDDFTELGNARRTRSPFPGSAYRSALTCIIRSIDPPDPGGIHGRLEGEGRDFRQHAGSAQIAIRDTFRMCAEVSANWLNRCSRVIENLKPRRRDGRRNIERSHFKMSLFYRRKVQLLSSSPSEILFIIRPCYPRVRQTCAIMCYQRHTK